MKKKLLQSFCWVCFLCFSTFVANAQVQYSISKTGNTYQVKMKPSVTWTGTQAYTYSAQVTVVAPNGGNFTPTNVQSQFGAWNLDNAIARGPIENSARDYITFYMPSAVTGTTYTSGQEINLFSFDATGSCNGTINLINNSDPFMPSQTTGTNSLNLNVGNYISTIGGGGGTVNAYTSNYGSGAACPSAPCLIKYQLVKTGNTYQVNMIPQVTYMGSGKLTSSQQVTFKVPTGFAYTNLTSLTSGATYAQGSRINTPTQAPSFDYISFNLTSIGTSSLNYTNGVPVSLFKFDASNTCNGNVALMPDNDPFTSNPNYNSKQQLTVFGYGQPDIPICFEGSGSVACPAPATNCLVEYELEYLGGTKYRVSMIPKVTYTSPNNVTSTQQVTVKVPTGFQFNNLTNLVSGVSYLQGSRVNNPSQATGYDYIMFNLQSLGTGNITYTNGTKVPLFTFDKTGTACTGDSLRLMNDTDPFTSNLAYNSKQQLTVAGYGQPDIPICIKGSGAVPCANTSCLVEYELEYIGGTKYRVSMIPKVTYTAPNNTTSTQQVTVKVPTGFQFANLTNLVSGVSYLQGSRVNAPSQASGFDYIMFNLQSLGTTNITYTNGTKVPLFTFDKTGAACTGDSLRLMKDNDPFTSNLAYNSKQQLTVSGYGQPDIPVCVKGSGAAPCVNTSCLVEYELEYISGTKYRVSMIPKVTYTAPNNTTSTQQVTLKVPTGFQFNNLTNLVSGVSYLQGSRVNAPSQATGFDYIMFNLQSLGTTNISYTNGTKVPLFTFDKTGAACTGDSLRLMRDNDPFTSNLAYNSKQQLTVSGYGQPDIPICIKGSGAAPCVNTSCLVEYELEYISGTKYRVSMIPKVTYTAPNNTTSTQQVTLKVPTGFQFNNLTNLVSGVSYLQGSRVNAPSQATGFDYIMFNLQSLGTTNITYTNGTKVPLFTFDKVACTGDSIRLMRDNDPFVSNPNYNSKQQLTVSGYGQPDIPVCIKGTGAVSCVGLPACTINYQLETVNGCEYQVSMIPNVSWTDANGGITKVAKVTLRVPHNCFSVANLTSLAFGANFTIANIVTSPPDNPGFDYICFSMTTVPTVAIPYVQGQKVPLFTFKNGGNCCGNIELMPSTDPFAHGNTLNQNFDQHWVTSGTGTDGVEPCITGTAQACIPANGLTNLLGNDVTICQGASTNLSVSGTFSSYAWSPSTGLSCTNCANPTANPTVTTTYSVTATTASGCPLKDDIIVTVTPAPTNIAVTPVNSTSCTSGNGSITVTATGSGTLEYSLDGTNWQTSNVFNNLTANSYTVLVRTQGASCTAAFANNPVVISSAVAPSITNVSSSNPTDCGVNNGTISITATGAGAPFLYSINNGSSFQASSSFTSLAAGTYQIIVKGNASNCQTTAPDVVLVAPVAPVIVAATPTITSDCTLNDGSINVTASGGQPPLEYSIDGTNWQASNIFNNLAPNNYFVRVRNGNNSCVVTASSPVTVAMPPMPNITNVISTAPSSCGSNNGSIAVTGAGGQGQLEYSIDGTNWQTGGIFTNLASGTYQIYIRNQDNSCPKPYAGNPVVLNAPAAPAIVNIAKTNPNSCTVNNGSIVISATGAGTLEYSIDGGASYQSSNTFNNLGGGNYNVHVRVVGTGNACVTSSNNCVLTQPTQASITTVVPTATSDCGQNDGTITINATGGTAPLQYSINNGTTWQTNNTFTGVAVGSYTIKVRNADNSCELTHPTQIIINQPQSANITNASGTPASCGQSNGTITVTATGGIAPLEYSLNQTTWQVSNVFNNLPGGSYTVYVRNANATCVKQYNSLVNISAVSQANIISVIPTNITDCNLTNGTISVNATGGLAPLQYSKDGGNTWQTSNVFSGLTAGTYNIKVRNADESCPATASPVTITSPEAPVIVAATPTNPTDCSLNDGTITVTATGGITPLQYSLNGLTWQTSNIFTNLSSGNYTVYVRNNNGTCVTQSASAIIITSPVTPTITNVSSSNPTSCGIDNGTITITATPSVGLQYSINGINWQSSGQFANLQAGSYNVYVRYGTGLCNVAYTLNPVILTSASSVQILTTIAVNPTGCSGLNNGSITISANGGVGPLQYSKDNGLTYQFSNIFTNLGGGTYNIVVKDANGICKANSTATLVAPVVPPTPTGTPNSTSSCALSNGTITVTSPLGANFEYSINNGSTWQTSTVFSNLAAGNYAIIARTIGTTCTGVSSAITVEMPAMPTISSVDVDFAVSGCAIIGGEINVNVSNVGSWEYSINGGLTWQTSPTFSNLSQGSYDVMVRNALNPTCYKPYQGNPVQITGPEAPSITNVSVTQSTVCAGANGTITITVAGGSAPIEYSINGGSTYQNANVFTGLSAGTYQIKVKDANGCETTGSPVVITGTNAPNGLTASAVLTTDCNLSNGSIVVSSVTGGSAPYEYSINGTTWQTSNLFTNLAPGAYTLSVRNAGSSCTYTNPSTILVGQPTAPTINTVNSTPATCGGNDGSIIVSGSTGALFSINGINYQTSSTFSNLAPGSYTVYISNANGSCKTAYTQNPVIISSGQAVNITNITVTNPANCSVNPTGTIVITATGGIAPYEYSINGGITFQSSNTFNNVIPGSYSIVVRGSGASANCPTTFVPVTINTSNTPQIVNSSAVNPTLCLSNGSISIFAQGGIAPLQYSIDGTNWQLSNQFNNLAAGSYILYVRNADGTCTQLSNAAVVLTAPAKPAITNVAKTNPTNCISNNGTITVTASPNTNVEYSIDNIHWQTSNQFTNVEAGAYNVYVRNINGSCEVAYTNNPVILTGSGAPTIVAVEKTNSKDCNQNDGTITVQVSNSNTQYQYSIDNGATYQLSSYFTGLPAGSYTIKVTNLNGDCPVTQPNVVLTAPASPSIAAVNATPVSNCGSNTGSISITANGGIAPLQYSIDNGANWTTSNVFNNLASGSYAIRVRNAGGSCVTLYPTAVEVGEPQKPTITSVVDTDPTACGVNDGQIVITATGGTSSYEYSINGITWQSSNTFNNLASGTYSVFVRNAGSNCPVPYALPITLTPTSAPSIILVNPINPTTCNGNNGTITVTATGGSGNLEYSINNGTTFQSSNLFTNLTAGVYNIVVRNVGGTCAVNYPAAVLTAPTAPSIAVTVPTPTTDCNGTDGKVTIIASGSGILEYSIDGINWQTTNTFFFLPAGTYTPSVRILGTTCTTTGTSVTVTQPSNPPSVVSVNSANPTACGSNNGTITVTAIGGTSPLQYSIDGINWQTSNVFANLPGGTYFAYARNANGTCSSPYAQNPVILNPGPTAPSITNVTATNITDCSKTDGTITITATGGIAPLQYSIDGGATWQNSGSFNNLPAGSYEIVVRNADGSCVVQHVPVKITAPVAPTLFNVVIRNPTDCGLTNGQITVLATGTGNIQYSIDSMKTWSTSNIFPNIGTGTYYIFIRNANGTCKVASTQNPYLACEFDLALRKKLAPNQDSIIRLGRDVDFRITVFNQGVLTATGIEVTDYIPKGMILSPNDNNGWAYSPAVPAGSFVNPNNNLKVVKTIAGPLVSKDSTTISIKLRAIFGGPNTRLINVAEISGAKDINGVPRQDVDSYADNTKGNDKQNDNVITDKNVTDEDDEDPAPIKLDDYDPHGYVYCDKAGALIKGGQIQLVSAPAGGTIYFVNDANNVPLDGRNGVYQFFTNGVPGTYNITYVHPFGYQLSTMILPQAGSFNPAGTDGTAIDKDGVINNIVTLGSLVTADTLINKTPSANPYYLSFTLNANETTLISHNNIPVGCACINSIVCQDVNGDGIAQPNEPGLNGVKVIVYNCATNQKVDSATTANGGKYQISGLLSGSYKLKFVLPSGYTYVANGQPVSVDAQGFTACFPLGLTGCESKPVCVATCPSITISPDVTICAGTTTNLVASGGVSYSWSPANSLNTISGSTVTASPNVTTVYTVTASNNGCSSTAQVTVTVITPPSNNFSVSVTKPTSCTTNNGSITVNSSQTNLEYSIDNGATWQTSNVFNNVASGTYVAIIRFAGSQCPTSYPNNPVTVSPLSAPTITNVATVNPNNCANPNGSITVTATGAAGLEYSVNNGTTWQTSNQFTGLAAGTYNILVRNADGTCAVSYPVVTLSANQPIINTVNVNGDCANSNRSITILASGGQAPLEYSINGGQTWFTNNVFTGLAPGYYTIMVRNFNGTCAVTYGNQPVGLCAFDLALRKKLAPGQNSVVRLGDVINYRVTVFNQGSIAASNVSVVDYIPRGMQIFPSGSNGWTTISDSMATNLVAGPIQPGDSVTLNLSMRLVFGGPNTSLKNVAEIKDAKDPNGNSIPDIDSTPDMVKNNDTEKDDIINENGKNGGDEDDSDPANITLDNFDPSGYVYCEKTGKIVTGGKIKLVSAPQGGEIFFTPGANGAVLDGSNGMYQIFTNGVSGIYTFTYEHPNKYPLSTTCLPQNGAFNPSGQDGNPTYDKDGTVNGTIHLGSLANNGSLVDKLCAANKYFLSFDLEANEKVLIATNNIPVSCGVIIGTICTDANGDGLPQAGEPGIANLKVSIFDCKNPNAAAFATVTTDATGKYQFDGLPAGEYKLQVTLPSGQKLGGGKFNSSGTSACIALKFGDCIDISGCVQMCPTINNVLTMKPWCPKNNGAIVIDATCQGELQYSIDGGKTYQKLNAFLNLPAGTYNIYVKNDQCETAYGKVVILECEDMSGGNASVSGKAFKTCTNDAIKGANKGLAGVKVTLTSSNGATQNVTTNANGLYNFTNVEAGNYTVTFEKPQGFAFVKQDQGNNDANDSDVDASGKTATISVTANQLVDNVDAGLQDVEGPTISFTHPWLVGKKDGDTVYMECAKEYFFSAKDATATDNCDPKPTVKFGEDPVVFSKDCSKDGYIVKMHCGWIATDACGNKSQIWFNFIVRDTGAPTLVDVPANITVASLSAVPAPAAVKAADMCDKTPTVIFDESQSGNVITRTWTAFDDCGNKTTGTQTITIKTSTNCTIANPPVAVTSPASCGGKDGKAKMAPNNFTFKWSDGSDADVRLDLAAGTYIVTVTDAQGCTAEVAVKILDGCGQKILALAKDLEVKQVACNTTDYEYCLDLDLIDLYLGGYEVFDNGVSMKNSMKPCEVRRHHEYVLDGVEDYQNVTLEEWSIEGKTYSGTFNTLQELVVLMNKWDNSVIWTVDNITSTIEAINANQNRYGTMKLKLTDGSGLSWDFGVSEYTSAHGLKIPFDMGLHRIELVHKITNYRDTTLLNLVCTTPSTFELDLEEGEHKEVDISTTELVGKKCVVKVCAGDPNNPAAEFHAMPNKEAMIMVDAMEKGWERTVYTMCDEYNVCDTATIKVSVREKQIPVQPVDSTIVIYNGFSPNDDGQNDVFLIKNIEFFPNSTLTIYNRWGNSVFSTKAYQNNWKGTFDEKALPDGTYFYVLEVKGQKTRSGYVELRR
jgi:gliding motility-associated-like protein/uncharacterized repeat protein (TIGR01451 family)